MPYYPTTHPLLLRNRLHRNRIIRNHLLRNHLLRNVPHRYLLLSGKRYSQDALESRNDLSHVGVVVIGVVVSVGIVGIVEFGIAVGVFVNGLVVVMVGVAVGDDVVLLYLCLDMPVWRLLRLCHSVLMMM